MRKRDPAEIETDNIIAEMEKRITKEYRQAEREIKEKIDGYTGADGKHVTGYWEKFQTKDKIWQKWVDEGKKKESDYQAWRVSQLAVGERWEKLREQLAEDLYNADKIAKSIANGYMPEVYAINHNFGTYEIEKGARIDTSYTLYSRETVEKILREDLQMLPDPGEKVAEDIAKGVAIRWNNQQIQSVMIQGILQGNSIPDIATRIANVTCKNNRNAAIRNARTMATSTQNKGRMDAYQRAKDKGVKVKKMWLATLDMRTRHQHRQLDKQVRELDKPFRVDGYELMQPGDYSAPGFLVYNCRCCIRAKVDGLERKSGKRGLTDYSQIEGMTYEQWKKSKKEKPNKITLPEEKAESRRAKHIREYRGYGGNVKSGRRRDLDVD